MLVSCCALIYRAVDPPLCIIYHNDILEGWHELRLEIRPSQIWYDMCKERYIRSRVFAWEIGLGANNEVAGFEVIESGEDLRSIEGWVQGHQYRAQLEERVGGLRRC